MRALPIAALALGCGANAVEPAPTEAGTAVAAPVESTTREVDDAPIERVPVERYATAEAMIGKHVLVAAGTELALGPEPDAPTLKLRAADEDDPFAYAFEVKTAIDGVLVLAPAQPEARCDRGLVGLDVDAPRFHLAMAAVAPVLARERETRFDDGTWVRVRAGAAIVLDGARGIVDVGGLRLHAAIDPADVGNAFLPAVANAPESTPDSLARSATIRYGTHRLADSDERLHRNALGRPYVLARNRSGDDELVDLVAACASVRARVEPEALGERDDVPPAHPSAIGSLYASSFTESWTVPAGVPASWKNGVSAGKLLTAQHWTTPPKIKKKLRCFAIGDASSVFEPVELCFAAKDVEHVDPASALGLSALSSSSSTASLFAELDAPPSGLLDELAEAGGGVGALGAAELGAGGGVGEARIGSAKKGPLVAVRVGTFSSSGTRDAKALRKSVGTKVRALPVCAEGIDPPVMGALQFSFTIADDGSTSDVSVAGITDIADCVRDIVAAWTFARGGEATVEGELEVELVHP
ncbi:MAG TPA: hypothetical protein VG755_24325 [Nannocystaceae bacterium]|nr:hypothetical protein [Nannocystaceae bacterium]